VVQLHVNHVEFMLIYVKFMLNLCYNSPDFKLILISLQNISKNLPHRNLRFQKLMFKSGVP
jgi:hypothetical protein